MDQLASYRAEQRLKYEKKQRMEQINNKYKDLLEFDPIKRSASRIVNCAKRYFKNRKPINENSLDIIPGIFRIRFPVTELNTLSNDIQKDLFNSLTNEQDHLMKEALIQSFKNTYPVLYWVVLDLREYGTKFSHSKDENVPIYLPELDIELYLMPDQIQKVIDVWNQLNPDFPAGIRFQQMVEASKSLSFIYNQLR